MSADRSRDGAESAARPMAAMPRVHSVDLMPIHSTRKRSGVVLAGAAAINALVFSPLGDEGFLAIALLGPIATGLAVGIAQGDVRLAAAAWAVSGLFWLVVDWIVNGEDVAFHAVLAVVMATLVALGAGIGRGARRVARHTTSAQV
jgi:hypothetical protein